MYLMYVSFRINFFSELAMHQLLFFCRLSSLKKKESMTNKKSESLASNWERGTVAFSIGDFCVQCSCDNKNILTTYCKVAVTHGYFYVVVCLLVFND